MKTVDTSRVGSTILHRGTKIGEGRLGNMIFLLHLPIFTESTTGIILWRQLVIGIFLIFIENCMRRQETFAFVSKLARFFFHFPNWDFGILDCGFMKRNTQL